MYICLHTYTRKWVWPRVFRGPWCLVAPRAMSTIPSDVELLGRVRRPRQIEAVPNVNIYAMYAWMNE